MISPRMSNDILLISLKNVAECTKNNSSSLSATRSFSFIDMMFYERDTLVVYILLSITAHIYRCKRPYPDSLFPKFERIGVGFF